MDPKAIDALLPQTQCQECGYPGCLPYATAIASGQAPINKCPPGGVSTLEALGALMKVDVAPYLAEMQQNTRAPSVAKIIEADCVGCTKCISACPVDAIIGSAKKMHTVWEEACTGCGLCVEPCPVDCIEMIEQDAPRYDRATARARFAAKTIRGIKEAQEKEARYRARRELQALSEKAQDERDLKKAYIEAAMKRVLAKKSS